MSSTILPLVDFFLGCRLIERKFAGVRNVAQLWKLQRSSLKDSNIPCFLIEILLYLAATSYDFFLT